MKVLGTIKKIEEVVKGNSKDGKEWQKVNFLVSNNDGYQGKEQLFYFEIFGQKVDDFIKYNKEGSSVEVDFNVRTNEYKGKYYTSLQAWKVFKAEQGTVNNGELEVAAAGSDDLPF